MRESVTYKSLFISLNILRNRGINILKILLTFLIVISCNNDDSEMENSNVVNEPTNIVIINLATDDMTPEEITVVNLTKRSGSRPETTMGVPHIQIGVELVPEVNEELFRRVYSLPGIENRQSVIAGWRGLWLTEEMTVFEPNSLLSGREFGHIHDDGSLHIFLELSRSTEAVETCWAIFHPYAIERSGWDGFVMLYTPQSFNELDVTFQLIVDAYNYVTGQNLLATDYY